MIDLSSLHGLVYSGIALLWKGKAVPLFYFLVDLTNPTPNDVGLG